MIFRTAGYRKYSQGSPFKEGTIICARLPVYAAPHRIIQPLTQLISSVYFSIKDDMDSYALVANLFTLELDLVVNHNH